MENSSSRERRMWIGVAIVAIAIVLSTSFAVELYGAPMMWTPRSGNNGTNVVAQQMTIDEAVHAFKNYLGSIQNSNIALHEVEEYQYNFYASYYEKNTGTFAFQMLIWKQGASYMMGMMSYSGATGIAVPEMGPNMMWNTKYYVSSGMMSGGMMGSGGGMMGGYRQGTSTPMTVTASQAHTLAQRYLNNSLPGKMAGDADTYYGYYNIDVLLDGSTYGMLSVNGYTGEVWYHSWHGTFIQTVTVS